MPVEHLFIQLDNPSMTFTPGDTVSGNIFIRTNSVTAIKDFKTTFEGIATTSFKDNRSPPILCTDSIVYFSLEEKHIKQAGRGSTSNAIVVPGEEVVQPFIFHLPSDIHLPSNFVSPFGFGSVEYAITSSITEASNRSKMETDTVSVCPVIKVSPKIHKPFGTEKSSENGLFSCCSGVIKLTIKLGKTGFYPGEKFKAELEVENGSSKGIMLFAKLLKEATFSAMGRTRKTCEKVFCEKRGQLKPGASERWKVDNELDYSMPPTGLGGCKIINVQYKFKVEAKDTSKNLLLEEECPIFIGSSPSDIITIQHSPPTPRPLSALGAAYVLTPTDAYVGGFPPSTPTLLTLTPARRRSLTVNTAMTASTTNLLQL